jgi:Cu/Ag efflux pump CusA
MDQFNAFIEASFPAKKVGSVYEKGRSFDIILRLNKDYTESKFGIMDALIDTHDGKKVPLATVAEITDTIYGPGSISRENVQRKVVVSANIASGDVAGTVGRVAEFLENELHLDEGYRLEYGGQFESAESASRTLWLTTAIAVLVVFVLLYSEFKSTSLSVVVLLNLPLALIGGILATYFTSAVMSIPAIIGLITLFGIATRNGILLVSRYQHLRSEGIAIEDVIIKGSADRLTPILMTAFTSALALVPMIINGSASGNEIQSPMAVVVLGGLLSSTLLNIFVVPAVYRWVVRKGWV